MTSTFNMSLYGRYKFWVEFDRGGGKESDVFASPGDGQLSSRLEAHFPEIRDDVGATCNVRDAFEIVSVDRQTNLVYLRLKAGYRIVDNKLRQTVSAVGVSE